MSNAQDTNSLQTLQQSELDAIIKKHIMFVKAKSGGARASVKFKSMVGLTFHGADLSGADFTGCDMRNCFMSGGNFLNAIFYGCNLQDANLVKGNFSRADFRGADLTGADLTDADLTKADMRMGAKIISQNAATHEKVESLDGTTIFKGSDLENANMSDARASQIDLSNSNLTNARMANIDLSQANLENANMSYVDLTKADLEGARMAGVVLTGATLTGTKTEGAVMEYVLTDKAQGKVFDYSEGADSPLVQILKSHSQWIQFQGKGSGQRADLSGYDLRNITDLARYSLTAIKAEDAIFQGMALLSAQMQSGDFNRSDFRDVKFIEADLRASKFIGAKMSRANLQNANLSPLFFAGDKEIVADLTDVDLSFSDLSGCNLQNAILVRANLQGSNLSEADIRGCDLTDANLENVNMHRTKKSD
jgi:uncharacterized protein YjbI with pentapeptide repeats